MAIVMSGNGKVIQLLDGEVKAPTKLAPVKRIICAQARIHQFFSASSGKKIHRVPNVKYQRPNATNVTVGGEYPCCIKKMTAVVKVANPINSQIASRRKNFSPMMPMKMSNPSDPIPSITNPASKYLGSDIKTTIPIMIKNSA